MPESAAPSPGVARVLAAFSVTVPPVVFLALAYAGLSDPVFAVNRLVGHRLYAPLRRIGRGAYLLANAVAFVALHFALAHASGGAAHLFAGGCAATPRVLHDRTCLLLTGGGAVAHAAVTLADRVAIPLLGIGDDARGYARGWRARFFEAAAGERALDGAGRGRRDGRAARLGADGAALDQQLPRAAGDERADGRRVRARRPRRDGRNVGLRAVF